MNQVALRTALASVTVVMALLVGAASALASGELDPTFGTDGFTVNNFGEQTNSSGSTLSPIELDDGSIISLLMTSDRTWLVKYGPDGMKDATFGKGGQVLMRSIDGRLADTSRVALQGDDLIVARTGRDDLDGTVYLQRYAASGAGLTSSFGSNGTVTLKLNSPKKNGSGWWYVTGLHTDEAGRIYLTGYKPSAIQAFRFLPNGQPDPSFGSGGQITISSNESVEPDPSLFTEDGIYISTGTEIWRIKADGTIDPTFAWRGLAGNEYIISLLKGPNDTVYLATGKGIRRLYLDGGLDLGFGEDGLLKLDDRDFQLDRVGIDSSGRFLFGGSVDDPVRPYDKDARFVRLLPNGQPDPTFGAGGTAVHDFSPGNDDYTESVMPSKDGGILSLTFVYTPGVGSNTDLVSRLDENGNLVPGFGENGGARITVREPTTDTLVDLIRLPSGELVASGSSGEKAALTRYLGDGKIDLSFGMDGMRTLRVGGTADGDVATRLVARPDRGVLVCVESNPGVRLVALDSSGAQDPAFGDGGYVKLNGLVRCAGLARVPGGYLVAGTRNGAPTIIKLDLSGKVFSGYGKAGVASGPADGWRAPYAFVATKKGAAFVASSKGMTKFTPGGKRAMRFGKKGFLRFDGRKKRPAGFNPVAITTGQGGSVYITMNYRRRISIYKRTAVGGLDKAFGFGGGLSVGGQGKYTVTDAGLDSRGRLVMSATITPECTFRRDCQTRFSALRLNLKGRLDKSFAGDGGQSGWIGERSRASALILTGKGIILGGTSNTVGGRDDFSILRYTP